MSDIIKSNDIENIVDGLTDLAAAKVLRAMSDSDSYIASKKRKNTPEDQVTVPFEEAPDASKAMTIPEEKVAKKKKETEDTDLKQDLEKDLGTKSMSNRSAQDDDIPAEQNPSEESAGQQDTKQELVARKKKNLDTPVKDFTGKSKAEEGDIENMAENLPDKKSKKTNPQLENDQADEEAGENKREEAVETSAQEKVEESKEKDFKKTKAQLSSDKATTEDKTEKSIVSGGIALSPDGKVEPEEANYRRAASSNKCGNCAFFVEAGAACQKVDYPIDPNYTCNFFQPQGMRAMSMIITKASVHNGVRRWAATGSDTDPDQHGEACSPELFAEFINLFNKSEVKPFLGVAHYPRLSGKGVAGEVESVYMDGKKFKAKGTFSESPLGDALFNAVAQDRMSDRPDKIRISLAWWDLGHKHGDSAFFRKSLSDSCAQCSSGHKIDTYVSGYLDHLAATRVPVNNRTELSLEMKSMAITRKEDAASIVDEILATQLEDAAHGTTSQKALVVRSNTGLPREAYAISPDENKPETWKVQLWEATSKKVTLPQLVKASEALSTLTDAEKLEAIKVIRGEYRQLGVKAHEWPENIRPEFPAVPTEWDAFTTGLVKLASSEDTIPYIEPYVTNFKAKAFTEIEGDLTTLETMVDELTTKGETMDELVLNENDPFESRLLQFKSQVEEVQGSNASLKDKESVIKAKFAELADAYCADVLSTKSNGIDQATLAATFASALGEAMAPVLASIALINKRLDKGESSEEMIEEAKESPKEEAEENKKKKSEATPQRKSVAVAAAQPVQKSGAQYPSIEQIARASVGLH